MNRNRWILAGTAILAVLIAIILYTSYTTMKPTPTPPAINKAAPAKLAKKSVTKPPAPAAVAAPASPAEAVPQINIYNGCCQVPPVSQPAAPTPRASAPAPTVPPAAPPATPTVQPSATSICSEADNYYCATPHSAVAPQSAPVASAQPPRPVNILSGNTFQLNVLSGNGSYNGGTRGHYGSSTYGWTPGHEELRYDPRTGVYYRVWVAHPHPGY